MQISWNHTNFLSHVFLFTFPLKKSTNVQELRPGNKERAAFYTKLCKWISHILIFTSTPLLKWNSQFVKRFKNFVSLENKVNNTFPSNFTHHHAKRWRMLYIEEQVLERNIDYCANISPHAAWKKAMIIKQKALTSWKPCSCNTMQYIGLNM